MEELNIFDSTPRVVECIETRGYSELKKGERYHMIGIIVHSWITEVYLKEFPNTRFNSVLFAEVDK